MAINKKLIHFKNKENFNNEVANGNILDTSIVFIQDTKEIYTHGQFYDGSKVDLSDIEASIQNILNTKQDNISDLEAIRSGAALGATSIQPSDLANVAKTGSYDDLINKPTIPSAVTESTVSGWGFTKNTGTVTGVKVNGSTKNPSSGIVDLGTVITAVDSSMSSTSKNPVQNKIIKSYIDSNCNIPTETATASSKSLTANKYYRWINTPTSITVTLATPSNTSILNNYMFEFTASSSGCTLSVPSTIKWINGTAPSIEAGKTYQISIINNLATVAKFS